MNHNPPCEDAARRWRRFGRAGWRMAGMFAALWFGALTLLFRLAPAPASLPWPAPLQASWWPMPGDATLDIRALWSPAAFALPTPAGFSHSLRHDRARLAPPVQAARPPAAFLARPPAVSGLSKPGRIQLAAAEARAGSSPLRGVFPPRIPERDAPRLDFPGDWESRLFSGIDLNFGVWTNVAWSARIEMNFDPQGVPVSVLLAQSSGLPEVDRRLARSASGWRLLEPAAARRGVVGWNSPAAPETPAPGPGARQGAP